MTIIDKISKAVRPKGTRHELRVYTPDDVFLQAYENTEQGLEVAQSHARAIAGWVMSYAVDAAKDDKGEEVWSATAVSYFNVFKKNGDLLGRYINGMQAEKDARTIRGYVRREGKLEYDYRINKPEVTFEVMLMDTRTIYRFLHDEDSAILCAKSKRGIVYKRTVSFYLDFRSVPEPDDSTSETTYDEEGNA